MSGSGARVIHAMIAVPLAQAYAFARQPCNFARWAAGLASALHETDEGWIVETPRGRGDVCFSPLNDHGVLDHWVHLPGEDAIYVPLRMIANGDATLVELVLFQQPGMSDADFARDARLVKADLAALKRLLETGTGQAG